MQLLADILMGLFWLWVILAIYFLPTFLAFGRKVGSPWSVAVINLFLGWTLIGWVVALAMSVRAVPLEVKPSSDVVDRVG